MSKKIDYTATAQRIFAQFPFLTFLSIQINFWIIANVLLGTIMHLQTRSVGETFHLTGLGRLTPVLMVCVTIGILNGVCLGSADYYFDRKMARKQSLGRILLLKTIISVSVLLLFFALLRFVLFDWVRSPQLASGLSPKSWEYIFYILAIYYFFMTLLINFINQVNKKYGPGVLVPLLLGKYSIPKEEERIFMFMDLKSSTSIAEKLGHIKYSEFIRDSFMDINRELLPFRAEVYQYVGDEIVVTWRVPDGLKDFSCIRFFFATEKHFLDKAEYYTKRYGFLPHFKAGLHMGTVTVVEIGDIKRDIAYHGDTLNTAARIQSVCNEYNKKFLISEYLLKKIDVNHHLKAEALGMIQLRGKTSTIGIASLDYGMR
ncbi:adenylate cyclase [Chryseolinea serpens]|uniref:Adenylate cyclase n=1 Tax=Chryseolinea serpens TaxID=947013 RepID=A0A1M5VDF0_9BACT|nr:adenylate/guanylate cyclase domain-containing protein [Chryseolinea serpens]SHH73250.1 adenylate cyclase [Chryseolinea serpens]